MPKWVLPVLLILGSLALIPYACVARSRVVKSSKPRVHLVPDMDNQGKFKSQQLNAWFADTRAMRSPVPGTVAREGLTADEHFYRGLEGESYATEFPIPLSRSTLERGRERYGIYCAPCHGLSGHGNGIVSARAERLQQGSWVPPSSFHDEPAASREIGHIFNTISNGIRTMPSYGSQVPVEDRWAIVGYVKALQRSQRASADDVPAEERARMR